jgi:hypothetical protein
VRGDPRQALLAVLGGVDGVPLVLEALSQGLDEAGLVFDDKDSQERAFPGSNGFPA